jgi:hypothetical protein
LSFLLFFDYTLNQPALAGGKFISSHRLLLLPGGRVTPDGKERPRTFCKIWRSVILSIVSNLVIRKEHDNGLSMVNPQTG